MIYNEFDIYFFIFGSTPYNDKFKTALIFSNSSFYLWTWLAVLIKNVFHWQFLQGYGVRCNLHGVRFETGKGYFDSQLYPGLVTHLCSLRSNELSVIRLEQEVSQVLHL